MPHAVEADPPQLGPLTSSPSSTTQPPSTTLKAGSGERSPIKFGRGYIGGDSEDSKKIVVHRPTSPDYASTTLSPPVNDRTKKAKSHASKRIESADFKRHASLGKISVSSNSTRAPKSPSEAYFGSASVNDNLAHNNSLVAAANNDMMTPKGQGQQGRGGVGGRFISQDDMMPDSSKHSSISTAPSATEPDPRDPAAATASTAKSSNDSKLAPTTPPPQAAAPGAEKKAVYVAEVGKSDATSGGGGGFLKDPRRPHFNTSALKLHRDSSHMSTVDLGTVHESPDGSSDSDLTSTRQFPKALLDVPSNRSPVGTRRTSITLERSPIGSILQQSSVPPPRRAARVGTHSGGGDPLSHQRSESNDTGGGGGANSNPIGSARSTASNVSADLSPAATPPSGAVVVPMLTLQSPSPNFQPTITAPSPLLPEELIHTVTLGEKTNRDLWSISLTDPLSARGTPSPTSTANNRLDDAWGQVMWTFLAVCFLLPFYTGGSAASIYPHALIVTVFGLLGLASIVLRLVACGPFRSRVMTLVLLAEPWLLMLVVGVILIVGPTYIFEPTNGANGVVGRLSNVIGACTSVGCHNATTESGSLTVADYFRGSLAHSYPGGREDANLWRQLLVALEVSVLFFAVVFAEKGRRQREHLSALAHWAMEVLAGGTVEEPAPQPSAATTSPNVASNTVGGDAVERRASVVVNRSASFIRQRYQVHDPAPSPTPSEGPSRSQTPQTGASASLQPPILAASSPNAGAISTTQASPMVAPGDPLAFITDTEAALPSNPPTAVVYLPPLVTGAVLTGVFLGIHGPDATPTAALLSSLWTFQPLAALLIQFVAVLLLSSSPALVTLPTRERARTVVVQDHLSAPAPGTHTNGSATSKPSSQRLFTKRKFASRLPVATAGRGGPRPNERFSHSTFHPIVVSTAPQHGSSDPHFTLDRLPSLRRRSEGHLLGFPPAFTTPADSTSNTNASLTGRPTARSVTGLPVGVMPSSQAGGRLGSVGAISDHEDTWTLRGPSRSYSPHWGAHQRADTDSLQDGANPTPQDTPRRALSGSPGAATSSQNHQNSLLSTMARVQRAAETNDYLYWSLLPAANNGGTSTATGNAGSFPTLGASGLSQGSELQHTNAHNSMLGKNGGNNNNPPPPPPLKFSASLSLRRFYPLLFPGALPTDGVIPDAPPVEGNSTFCPLADPQLLAPLTPAAALQLAHMCLSHFSLLSPQVAPYKIPTMLLSVDERSIVMDCNAPFSAVFGIQDPAFLVGRSMHSILEWLGADDVTAMQELLTDVAFMPSVLQCVECDIACSRMLLIRTSGMPKAGGELEPDGGSVAAMPPKHDDTIGGRGAVFLEAWKFAGEDVMGQLSLLKGSPNTTSLTPPLSTPKEDLNATPRSSEEHGASASSRQFSSTTATTAMAASTILSTVPSFVVLRQPMQHAIVSALPSVACLADCSTAIMEAWSAGAAGATGLDACDVLGRSLFDVLGISRDALYVGGSHAPLSNSTSLSEAADGEISDRAKDQVLKLPYVGPGAIRLLDGRCEQVTVSIAAWSPPETGRYRSHLSFEADEPTASNRVLLLCSISVLEQQLTRELIVSNASSPLEPVVGVTARADVSSGSSVVPAPFLTPLSTGSYNAASLRGMQQRSSYRSAESSGSGSDPSQELIISLSRIVRDFNNAKKGDPSIGGGSTSSKDLLVRFADKTMLALQEAASKKMRRSRQSVLEVGGGAPSFQNRNSPAFLDSTNTSMNRREASQTSLTAPTPNPNRVWPPPGVKAVRVPNDSPLDPLVAQTSLIFADAPWAKLVSRDTQLCHSADVATTIKQEFQFGRSNKCHLTITDTFVSSVQFGIVRKLVKVDAEDPGFSPERSKSFLKRKVPTKTVVKVFLVDYSANGTYVNVKKIGKGKSVELSHSDLITFRLDNNRFFLGFKFELVEPFAASNVDMLGQSVVSMENLLGPGQVAPMNGLSPRQSTNISPPDYNGSSYNNHHDHADLSASGAHNNIIEWKIGEEMIGKGGNAEVYLGMNITYGTLIAVKRVPLPKEQSGLRQYKALQEEIALLSNAQHPNIVQYYGSSQSDTHLNILLEFVPGGSLRHILDNFGSLSEGAIMRYLRQILAGLNYLHSINIVHSDIKCANILVTEKGEVKLTDFGTAKPMKKEGDTSHDEVESKKGAGDAASASGKNAGDAASAAGGGAGAGGENDAVMIVGTLLWMAPELCRAESSPTFSTDIWSLGCCLIEMFTAFYPWAEYEFESQEQIINLLTYTEEPPELPEPPNDSPQYRLLLDIAAQCLSLDPKKRPSAAALLDTLHRFDQLQNPSFRRGGAPGGVMGPSNPMHMAATPRGDPMYSPRTPTPITSAPPARVSTPTNAPLSTSQQVQPSRSAGGPNPEQWANSGGSATSRTSMRSALLPPSRGFSGVMPQSDLDELNRIVGDIEAARSAIRRV